MLFSSVWRIREHADIGSPSIPEYRTQFRNTDSRIGKELKLEYVYNRALRSTFLRNWDGIGVNIVKYSLFFSEIYVQIHILAVVHIFHNSIPEVNSGILEYKTGIGALAMSACSLT